MKVVALAMLVLSSMSVSVSSFTLKSMPPQTAKAKYTNTILIWKQNDSQIKPNLPSNRDFSLPAHIGMLPPIHTMALSCLIPTSLGFIRYEYGVSYGYGTSVALLAWLILQQIPNGSLAYWHAILLIFYGIRLNIFLLYREICIPRFRKFREQIETKRTVNTTNQFTSRIPFVVGCSFLYACLVAPLMITSQVTSPTNVFAKLFISLSWLGFIIAALGDLQKAYIKGVLGENILVKGALYSRLRHPNYTGEILGWTASFAASTVVALCNWKQSFIVPLIASTVGWIGITFILAMAASGLEKRQKEKYGDSIEYSNWTKKSWAGPTLAR